MTGKELGNSSHKISLCTSSTTIPTSPPPEPSIHVLNQSKRAPSPTRTRSAKKPRTQLPPELGKYIERDVNLLKKLGWKQFVRQRRPTRDLGPMNNIQHPAKRLLQHYRKHGAPVKFTTTPWSRERVHQSIQRGAHKSCFEYLDFLEEEFIDMINKDQWVVLPYNVVKDLPGLRVSPPGVVPQRERRPRWICDYSYYEVNSDTLPLAALESMQFGHALDRILRHILLSNPDNGPVYLMKVDLSDGFYRVDLAIDDAPKLGVVFPTHPHQEPLVAIPLVLPMGWKNSPPIFSTVTETIADVANSALDQGNTTVPSHPLGNLARLQDDDGLAPSAPVSLSSSDQCKRHSSLLAVTRDPHLPKSTALLGYVDIFVDDFIGLAQGSKNRNRVRDILMTAIDEVFRPLSPADKPSRKEPISIKKLLKGDCSWATVKNVLGWIINTVDQTITLPPHRVARLAEILAAIPRSQKRISIRKWHKILGELRSMSLALPGARHLFSHMQQALLHQKGGRLSLKKGVHAAITDFKWILRDIESRPTRIAELVPLLASAVGHHDASGKGAGGGWFPSDHLPIRDGHTRGPFVWRLQWPEHIVNALITDKNPLGSISISDLELAGGLLHLDALAQAYDIRERTILSKTDNLATLYWQRKGSATTNKVPAYLLRLFGIHQRYHRYVARHDYLSGGSNKLADDTSRLFDLDDQQFLTYFNLNYPQKASFQLHHPRQETVSAVISALQKKQCKPESVLAEPNLLTQPGSNGPSSVMTWASTPYSKPSKTPYQSYKSSPSEFEQECLQQEKHQFALERLKITYGSLAKRSKVWGPQTLA